MTKVKYQIFISSTYDDLKGERDQVIKACLEMGHIPVGMEMFSAADEEQWQIITRQIDESDYYVVIVANRYGSMVDGIGYTEKEYDYAIEKGVPTLGFVLDSKASWPTDLSERIEEARSKLETFKQKVRLKPVNFWTSKDDLHAKCAIALMKAFNTQPRPGWVRSPNGVGPEVASELSRLSSQNAKLIEEVTELRRSTDPSGLSQGEDELTLRFIAHNKESLGRSGKWEKVVEIKTTWNDVFIIVAETIIDYPWEDRARGIINYTFNRRANDQLLLDPEQRPPDFVKHIGITLDEKAFKMIRVQLMALRLVLFNQIDSEYETVNSWTLTELGKQQFAFMLAQRRS